MINKTFSIKEVVYEIYKKNYSTSIPSHIIKNMSIESYVHPLIDSMMLNIQYYLAGIEVENETTENKSIEKTTYTKYKKIPKTWWDMFKVQYFHPKLLKYFKVNYRKIPTEVILYKKYTTKKQLVLNPTIPIPEDKKDKNYFVVRTFEGNPYEQI